MTNQNEVAVVGQVAVEKVNQAVGFSDEGFNMVVDLTTASQQFCSMVANTDEERTSLFNAMNNPDQRLADSINMTLKIKDVYVEVVNCTNEETGEVKACPRIVLIDADGVSYQCVSVGIYSALRKLFQVYGVPTWKEPLDLKVVQITKGSRKMLTLNVTAKTKKK